MASAAEEFYEAYDVLKGKLARKSNEKGHERSATEWEEPNRKLLGRGKGTKGSKTESALTLQAGNRAKEAPPGPSHLGQARWKTKFCMFHLQGVCKYSTKCTFAHSMEEMKAGREPQKRGPSQVGWKSGTAPFGSPPNQAPAYRAPAQRARSGEPEQITMAASQQTANTHAQAGSAWLKLQEPMFVEPLLLPAQGEHTFHEASAPERNCPHPMDHGRSVFAPYGHIDYCPVPSPLVNPLWGA